MLIKNLFQIPFTTVISVFWKWIKVNKIIDRQSTGRKMDIGFIALLQW
ncbi:hypothetical protein [Photorhabdus australis]|nr:hypothetical protein [Photorhabdus australis]